MIIKLNKKQFDYLNNNLSKEKLELYSKLQINKTSQFIFIEIDNADEISDWAMNKQVQIGFDENYDLTPEGKILEELIDIFHIG